MGERDGLTAGLLVAGHQAARLLESLLTETSLGAGEAMLLTVLDEGELTMTGVMTALQVRASTATGLVSRLEKAGLVRRSPNPADKRSLLVGLTESGRSELRVVRPAFSALDALIAGEAGRPATRGHRRLLEALGELDARDPLGPRRRTRRTR